MYYRKAIRDNENMSGQNWFWPTSCIWWGRSSSQVTLKGRILGFLQKSTCQGWNTTISPRETTHFQQTYQKKNTRLFYSDTTSTEIIQIYLKGQTQNHNKSLYSKLWAKCSKNNYCGPKRVAFVAKVIILIHNFGYRDESLQIISVLMHLKQMVLVWMSKKVN